MRFEYECWKCPEWHETTARGAFWGLRNGFARPAVSIGNLRLTLPKVFSGMHRTRRVLVGNRGLLWLVPLPFGYGLLIGDSYRLWVGEWQHTLFEYNDHLQSGEFWRVRKMMKRYKRGQYANK